VRKRDILLDLFHYLIYISQMKNKGRKYILKFILKFQNWIFIILFTILSF